MLVEFNRSSAAVQSMCLRKLHGTDTIVMLLCDLRLLITGRVKSPLKKYI
jgi:hypothetical protein